MPLITLIDNDSDIITGDVAQVVAEMLKIKNSWAYWIGLKFEEFWGLIVALFIIHVVALIAAGVLPEPYSGFAATIANVVNPLSWGTALLSRLKLNSAATATANANTAVDGLANALKEMAADIKTHIDPTGSYSPTATKVIADTVSVSAAAPIPLASPPATAAA